MFVVSQVHKVLFEPQHSECGQKALDHTFKRNFILEKEGYVGTYPVGFILFLYLFV